MKYRLFSFDVDGTLFSYDSDNWGVSEQSVSALQQLRQQGYCLVLNSGRTMNDVPQKLKGLFDYYAVCNGSALIDANNEVVYEIGMLQEDVDAIIKYCEKNVRNVGLKSTNQFYYYNYENCLPEYMDRFNETYPCFTCLDAHKKETILSIAMDLSKEEVSALSEQFPNLEFAHGGFDYYEIYSRQANKVKGLYTVLERENITKEQCVAFGDSMNDFAILNAVGLPVIMADSHPNLLNHFTTRCLASHEEGIYLFLKDLNYVK